MRMGISCVKVIANGFSYFIALFVGYFLGPGLNPSVDWFRAPAVNVTRRDPSLECTRNTHVAMRRSVIGWGVVGKKLRGERRRKKKGGKNCRIM